VNDPLEAGARLAGRRGRVVLVSGSDADGLGRWSFVACEPAETIEAWGRRVIVRGPAGETRWEGDADPFEVLEDRAGEGGAAADHQGAPVPVAIGYLGYDLARLLEPGARWSARRAGEGVALPDMYFGVYGAVWRGDRVRGEAAVVGPDDDARANLARALDGEIGGGQAPRFGALMPQGDPRAERYRARFDRVKSYIRAGDVYQINLARHLVAPIERDGDALALLAALCARAPAAYGALIETEYGRVLSASPERFLSREAGSRRVETRPIKGTRRRTGEPGRDRFAAEELASDTKERAEHLMIVDLERNDLGRIAEVGSVRVDSFARVVELPTLYHLVSTISCELREGLGTADILRATFPSGSITGAPKVRAMEIIDELEAEPRGVYTGAIGYLGRGGAIELSIAIRTALLWGDNAHIQVGGGVVADSRVERELEETEEKADAWRRALAALREPSAAVERHG
jgi:para-aminobenzoate synthetase component I